LKIPLAYLASGIQMPKFGCVSTWFYLARATKMHGIHQTQPLIKQWSSLLRLVKKIHDMQHQCDWYEACLYGTQLDEAMPVCYR